MTGALGRRDPTIKLLIAFAASLALVAVIDPYTPLLFLVLTTIVTLAFGGVQPRAFLRALLPLVAVAIGFAWTNALFAAPVAGDLTWSIGPFVVSRAGLLFGIGIGLRGLAIGALALAAVQTSEPTQLVVSLVKNARLPFRIAYPLLAALRFLPLLGDEYARIELAQRVRGVKERPLVGRLPGVVALFADATRRATRIAVAMDARGFGAALNRTYWRETPITRTDWAFAALAVGAIALIFVAGATLGWLRVWDGRFSA